VCLQILVNELETIKLQIKVTVHTSMKQLVQIIQTIADTVEVAEIQATSDDAECTDVFQAVAQIQADGAESAAISEMPCVNNVAGVNVNVQLTDVPLASDQYIYVLIHASRSTLSQYFSPDLLDGARGDDLILYVPVNSLQTYPGGINDPDSVGNSSANPSVSVAPQKETTKKSRK